MNHSFRNLLLVLIGLIQLFSSEETKANRANSCNLTDDAAQQGAFAIGYKATFETQSNGTSVDMTFELLDTDKTGVVGFLWQQTPFTEFNMTDLGNNVFGITIDGLTNGQTVTYACKFAFAGGLAVTDYIDYVVGDVCNADPMKDASLSDIKVDGVSIDGFSSAQLSYEYETESTDAPTVTVTATQTGAMVQVDPASSIPGTTTILVTAEDEITTRTYSIEFKKPINYVMVWSDEFDEAGAVNSEKWHHQTIPIINGVDWANNEEQHYTDRTDNTIVENSTLKIIAKKEQGYQQNGVSKDYTSARLNSKFAFTYGRVDVRAKLPEELGTWPAIWTLGKNISETGAYWETQGFGTTPWPATGEIDIMEQFGRNSNEKNDIHGSTHTPRSSGATENTASTIVGTSTTEFHVYSILWDENEIQFLVDDTEYYTYNPTEKYGAKNTNPASGTMNWPFDEPQYIILNVAMGGILGGTIPGDFTEGVMEVDYVRVFQEGEASLSVTNASWSLDENSVNGTLVGTVSTTYVGNDMLTYSITSGNDDGIFRIDSSTGEVYVEDGSMLDFAINPSYTLTVEVTDGTLTETGTITIQINEISVLSFDEKGVEILRAYPNPVYTTLNLTFTETHNIKFHHVTDIAGREVAIPIVVESNVYELDFSNVKPGIYMVIMEDGRGHHSLRVRKL